MSMFTYIPSRGRADTARTLDLLPPELRMKAVMVVRSEEAEEYRRAGFPVLACPDTCDHIGTVRQWIVEHHRNTHRGGTDRFLMMLDDDIRTFRRWRPSLGKYTRAQNPDVASMYDRVTRLLHSYPQVGIAAHAFSNSLPRGHKEAGRVTAATALDAEWIEALEAEYRLPLQEDLDLTMQIISKGEMNAILTDFTFDNGAQGQKGGCETYRTDRVKRHCTDFLMEQFPGYIQARETPKGPAERVMWSKMRRDFRGK